MLAVGSSVWSIAILGILSRIFGDDSDNEEENIDEDTDTEDDDGYMDDFEFEEDLDDVMDEEIGVEQRLDDFERVMSEIRNEFDENEASLEQTDGRIDELEEEIDKIDQRTTELIKLYDTFASELNPLRESGSAMGGETDSMSKFLLNDAEEENSTDTSIMDNDNQNKIQDDESSSISDETSVDSDSNKEKIMEEIASGNLDGFDVIPVGDTNETDGEKEGESTESEPEVETVDHTEPPVVERGVDDVDDEVQSIETAFPIGEDDVVLPLRKLPESNTGQFATREWILFLIRRCGRDGARNALYLYREMGYITLEIEQELVTNFIGMGDTETDDVDVPPTVHERSLAYITYLCSVN